MVGDVYPPGNYVRCDVIKMKGVVGSRKGWSDERAVNRSGQTSCWRKGGIRGKLVWLLVMFLLPASMSDVTL